MLDLGFGAHRNDLLRKGSPHPFPSNPRFAKKTNLCRSETCCSIICVCMAEHNESQIYRERLVYVLGYYTLRGRRAYSYKQGKNLGKGFSSEFATVALFFRGTKQLCVCIQSNAEYLLPSLFPLYVNRVQSKLLSIFC